MIPNKILLVILIVLGIITPLVLIIYNLTKKNNDCLVGNWTSFSTCTQPCGGGTQTRTRTVIQNKSGNGKSCPNLKETQDCNTEVCKSLTFSVIAEKTFTADRSGCEDLYQYIYLETFGEGAIGKIREFQLIVMYRGNCEYGVYLSRPSTNQKFHVKINSSPTQTLSLIGSTVNANSLYYTVGDQIGVYIRSVNCQYYGSIKNPSLTMYYTNNI
jgi:hypothetical protein